MELAVLKGHAGDGEPQSNALVEASKDAVLDTGVRVQYVSTSSSQAGAVRRSQQAQASGQRSVSGVQSPQARPPALPRRAPSRSSTGVPQTIPPRGQQQGSPNCLSDLGSTIERCLTEAGRRTVVPQGWDDLFNRCPHRLASPRTLGGIRNSVVNVR